MQALTDVHELIVVEQAGCQRQSPLPSMVLIGRLLDQSPYRALPHLPCAGASILLVPTALPAALVRSTSLLPDPSCIYCFFCEGFAFSRYILSCFMYLRSLCELPVSIWRLAIFGLLESPLLRVCTTSSDSALRRLDWPRRFSVTLPQVRNSQKHRFVNDKHHQTELQCAAIENEREECSRSTGVKLETDFIVG